MDTRNYGNAITGINFGKDSLGNQLYAEQEVVEFEDEDGATVILDVGSWQDEREWLHQHIDQVGAINFIEDVLNDSVGRWVVRQYQRDEQVIDLDTLRQLINRLAHQSEQRLDQLLAEPLREQLNAWIDDYDTSIVENYYNTNRRVVGEE